MIHPKKIILIVSLEAKNIKTEEIYFTNKNNNRKCSFWGDDKLLNHLNIHDVYFKSFNFNASKMKYKEGLKRLIDNTPQISEVYILMDNDRGSYSEEQIDKKIKIFKNCLWSSLKSDMPIVYLKYEKDMMTFEDFLKLHSKNAELFKGYKKNHKTLYDKTMGLGGKNLKQLLENINKKQKCLEFKKLFEVRKGTF